MIQIVSLTGDVLFESHEESLDAALHRAMDEDVNLGGAYFQDMVLQNVELRGVVLQEAVFSDVTFKQCVFHHCDLEKADFGCCEFQDCEFRNTILVRANFSDCSITGTKFSHTDCSYANFSLGTISDCWLNDSNFKRANFDFTSCFFVSFMRTDLTESSLFSMFKMEECRITGETILPGGITWDEFKSDIVPAVLQCYDVPLSKTASREVWNSGCHTVTPLAVATSGRKLEQVKPLYRQFAKEFHFFHRHNILPIPKAV